MSQESQDDQLNLSEIEAERLLDDVLQGFGLPGRGIPAVLPYKDSNKKILQEYFTVRPTVDSHYKACNLVAKNLGVQHSLVITELSKAAAQKEAKKQREEYADYIYSQKLPLAKSIVGKSLVEVDNFLTTFKPTTVQEAKDLVKMATDMTTLLRLELGQSTQQIEIIHKTHKDVTVILEELRVTDPFMDYEVGDE